MEEEDSSHRKVTRLGYTDIVKIQQSYAVQTYSMYDYNHYYAY